MAIFKIGNGETGNRGTREPGNKGTREPGNKGTGEQGNRGTREPRNREQRDKEAPNSPPADLAVVYRDIRQFWDQNMGLLQYTNEPQNVHFQLRASCIREKYPSFVGKELIVTPEIHTHLKV